MGLDQALCGAAVVAVCVCVCEDPEFVKPPASIPQIGWVVG